jgi:hydrogenase maturation protein HypF
MTATAEVVRYRLRVEGLVQGVGFRPFVHRVASSLGLVGWVNNDTEGVTIEVEGPPGRVAELERTVRGQPPPLARVDRVRATRITPAGGRSFQIAPSRPGGAVATFVSPDAAVCQDCLSEMDDPSDRRYRYPFVNCTNCGPRFTITERLPYDRPHTTMSRFAMCADCAAEYHDPANRRFHAQPVACPACGPRVWFESDRPDAGAQGGDAAILAAQRALADGRVVAVKGLGGFHLACDAGSDEAVARLRRRKARPAKAFAVMVADLETARRLAHVGDAEAALLGGVEHPIVLLRRRASCPVSALVAPGNPLIGVMLPYTPLHHLLLGPVPGASDVPPPVLVMTSGNLSEEPICYDDADARARLGGIADAWLLHDRPIHVPCDDSVLAQGEAGVVPVRRSRGYAPLPVSLPFSVPPLLGVGGELKNAFCVASGTNAWMSQHIGDMGSAETLAAFERSVTQFGAMYGIDDPVVVADLHPGYHTRAWAETRHPDRVMLVQHHHAHVGAAMAEHGVGRAGRVIGFAFDGTGYGTDATIWGGEVLLAGYRGFRRVLHLRPVPLPGGDSTVRKPYRSALAHLWAAGLPWDAHLAPVAAAGRAELEALRRQLSRGSLCVPASSMGRLFDAVGSLVDLCQEATYEAQAAMELEALASGAAGDPSGPSAGRYRFGLDGACLDPGPVLAGIVEDLAAGVDAGVVAAGFHLAVAAMIEQAARSVRDATGVSVVALTGGVFQNRLLEARARHLLEESGFTVLTHRLVPPNDGGLALGQVVVAGSRLDGGAYSWREET